MKTMGTLWRINAKMRGQVNRERVFYLFLSAKFYGGACPVLWLLWFYIFRLAGRLLFLRFLYYFYIFLFFTLLFIDKINLV